MYSRRVCRYDGQTIHIEDQPVYELGNYLGGGAAGVVYEAINLGNRNHYAVKILHPVGFKLTRSQVLSRYTVAIRGVSPTEDIVSGREPFTRENIRWLVHPGTKQTVAAYLDPHLGAVRELPLPKCVEIWGWDLDEFESAEQNVDCQVRIGTSMVTIPKIPIKFVNFVRSRKSILREIKNMSKLSEGHPNVLCLEEVLELVQDSKSTIFLVLELASGGELFDRIRVDEGCDEDTARSYFKQLLSGVEYCHERGVCHRDLKPENLLLADNHDRAVLKIADFGLSALFNVVSEASRLDKTNTVAMRRLRSVVGSPHYVAPEVLQESGLGYDGAKADVWSLGVILYAMLAGNLPFGKDLLQCPRFEEFCRWKEQQRYHLRKSTASEVVMEDMPSSLDSTANPSGISERSGSFSRRREYPSWFFPRNLSDQVKALLVDLLDPNANERCSITDAQQNVWVTNVSPKVLQEGNVLQPACEQRDTSPIEEDNCTLGFVDQIVEYDDEDDDETVADDEDEEIEVEHVQLCNLPHCQQPHYQHRQQLESTPLHEDSESTSKPVLVTTHDWLMEEKAREQSDFQVALEVYQEELAALRHSDGEEDEEESRVDLEADPISNDMHKLDLREESGRSNVSNDAMVLQPQINDIGSPTRSAIPRHQRRLSSTQICFNSPPIAPQSNSNFGGMDDLPSLLLNPVSSSPTFSPCSRAVRSLRRASQSESSQSRRLRSLSPVPMGSLSLISARVKEGELDSFSKTQQYSENPQNVPVFQDLVKRSTRFSTSVPAGEVLQRISDIIEMYPFSTPALNIQQTAIVDWDKFTLKVMRLNERVCTVRIFLLRAGLYMVEFIRGSVTIFEFKQFYETIRERLSEIVKNDYTLSLLDTSAGTNLW